MTLQLYFNEDKIDTHIKNNIINNFQDCHDISICNIKTYMSTLGINYDSIEIKVIRDHKRINYVDEDFIACQSDLIYVNITNNKPFKSFQMASGNDTSYVKFVSSNVKIIEDIDKYIKNVTNGLKLYEGNIAYEMYDELCDIIEKLEENGNVLHKKEIDIYTMQRSKLFDLIKSNMKSIQRKPSPYINFCTTIKPTIKCEHPHISFGELGMKLAIAWSELTEEQKENYN